MKAPLEAGRVVCVTRGHDAGNWYAVLQVLDERMVLTQAFTTSFRFRLRTLEKPKKKQIKHLYALPFTISVSGKGGSGGKIADSDIRKALKAAKDAYEGAEPHPEKEECAFVQK